MWYKLLHDFDINFDPCKNKHQKKRQTENKAVQWKRAELQFLKYMFWKYIGRLCSASLKNISEWIHF